MSLRIWVEAVNSLQPQFPQQYWGPHYITVIRCKIHHQNEISQGLLKQALMMQ
jgi:hypothetical protein